MPHSLLQHIALARPPVQREKENERMLQIQTTQPARRAVRVQEALNNIGSWLLDVVRAEPGWNELILDIKPLAEQTFVRVREFRDDQEFIGTIGPLKEDSPVIEEIRKLQQAAYDDVRGTFFTASIVVAAMNWPNPQFSVGASYKRDKEPLSWKGEGGLSATDVREHLRQFPRARKYVPEWAYELLGGRASREDLDKYTQDGKGDHEVPNPYLSHALDVFKSDVREQTLINVVRTMVGGDVLVDATGSTVVPKGHMEIGPESQLRYQVIRRDNGMQVLSVFSSSEYVLGSPGHNKEHDGDELILREPTMKVFMDFLNNEDLDLIVIDPGSDHECYIERAQVQWIVGAPRNDGAKMALMNDNMQQLLGSLVAPNSMLLVAADPEDPMGRPLYAPDKSGKPKSMLVFTSPIEVAAIDSKIAVRASHALEVLKYAVSEGAQSVQINLFNPSTTLSLKQIKELLAITQEQENMQTKMMEVVKVEQEEAASA